MLLANDLVESPRAKAIREGRVNLRDSYARVEGGEVYLYNVHISPYSARGYSDHEPTRKRKLLLHKQEIRKLTSRIAQAEQSSVELKDSFEREVTARRESIVQLDGIAPG